MFGVIALQQQPPAAGEQSVHAVLQPDQQGMLQPMFQLQPQGYTMPAWMCNRMPD